MLVLLGRFMERSGVLPTTQFAYRKVWVLVVHFVRVSYTAKLAGGNDRAD